MIYLDLTSTTWTDDIGAHRRCDDNQYVESATSPPCACEVVEITPAWESLMARGRGSEKTRKMLVPASIQQRFFVNSVNDLRGALLGHK